MEMTATSMDFGIQLFIQELFLGFKMLKWIMSKYLVVLIVWTALKGRYKNIWSLLSRWL